MMSTSNAIKMATAIGVLALVPGQSLAQSASNQWNPAATPQTQNQAVQMAPPKYIGDAPLPLATTTVQQQEPAAPSRFAPPELDQRLDAGQYRPAPVPSQVPQPQPQTQLNTRQPNFSTGGYGPQPGFNPGYGAPVAGTGYGGYPQQSFGGFPPGYNGYPQFNGYPQGYGPQGYGPQGYGGYPGNGSNGGQSLFGFPGGFGNFPGTSSNGGVPGFGFSPFGFF